MSKPVWLLALVVWLTLATAPYCEVTAAAEELPEGSVDKALVCKSPVEFVETPLEQVVDFLADEHSINVVLDVRSLSDAGIAAESPVTLTLRDTTLNTALRLMLSSLGLTFSVEDNVLTITTPEATERSARTVVYDMADLLGTPDEQQAYEHNPDELIETITVTVFPERWDDVGGFGSIASYRGALIVRQSDDVHGQIRRLLASLREALKPSPVETPAPDEFDQALEKALTFDFDGVPLSETATFLERATGLTVYVDRSALDDLGIDIDVPVTAKGKNVTVRTSLNQWLEPLDLAWHRLENVLVITTPERAELAMSVRVYRVADLVTPEDADPNEASRDYGSLVDAVISTIAPDSWDEVGGPGAIGLYRNVLVICQTDGVHGEIERLFSDLRACVKRPAP